MIRRRIALRASLAVLVLLVAYALVVAISVARALHARNDALPDRARAALAAAPGSTRTHPRTVLVLGSDSSRARREMRGSAIGGTDSMLLVRIDPRRERMDMLSLPRDLLVDAPGHGRVRAGGVFELGGAQLAIRTVQLALDLDVHHVAIVDFDGFRGLVDALGGIEVDNPYLVRSDVDFDGRSWTFPSGRLELDGRRALAYARLRRVDQASIARNPEEGEELGRAFRQQRVLEATLAKLHVTRLLADPIGFPGDALGPFTTDIGVRDVAGWALAGVDDGWGGRRCRIGGTYVPVDGETALDAGEQLEAITSMFERKEDARPPLGPTDSGCHDTG